MSLWRYRHRNQEFCWAFQLGLVLGSSMMLTLALAAAMAPSLAMAISFFSHAVAGPILNADSRPYLPAALENRGSHWAVRDSHPVLSESKSV